MATGRTLLKYSRFYCDGYDLSGYTRQFGPLKWEFDAPTDKALTDEVMGAHLNKANLGVGELNGFFDNTASLGLHAVMKGAGVKRVIMIPIGIRAAPAQGDPAYCGEFDQLDYHQAEENGIITASIPFGGADAQAAALGYSKPWGTLLHAKGAEVAANTAVGVDDNGGATAYGGFLCYQLFSSDGTVTLKVQDAATNLNASFADLSGATSGVINASVTPAAGIVALANTATVRQYLRWQLVPGTAQTATFALAFVRATYP